MKQLFPRGKRIRPTDKDLVFHTALAALFPVFLLVVLLFHIRQIAGTNWQEVSLSQIAQDINIPYLLFSMGVAGLVCLTAVANAKNPYILEAQKERIEALISLVKDTINGNKEIKFSAFSNAKILELQSQFQEEVLEQWGNTESFREYKTMFSSHSKQIQEKEIESFYSMARNIFEKLAMYENSPAESSEVQAIVHEWQQYISEHFYECNKQILSNLGVLYITDERFTTFINRFSSGNLAAFFNEAIQIFCRGSE